MQKDLDQQIRRHHVIAKAKAGCSVAEIMAEQAKAFGDKAMSRAQVYDIVKKVKNGENMEWRTTGARPSTSLSGLRR